MAGPRTGERGQVAVYAVLLFPLLMLVLALVLAVGTIEDLRTRLRAQLDMAALTATQALDFTALARGEPPALVPASADALAREYLAREPRRPRQPARGVAGRDRRVGRDRRHERPGHRPDHRRARHRADGEHPDPGPGADPAARACRAVTDRRADPDRLGGREELTMQLPTRNRTPILALAALAIGLVVVGVILFAGRIGVPEPTPPPSASVPPAERRPIHCRRPKGAVRAFFAAFAAARRTDDPTLLTAFVTGTGLVRLPDRGRLPRRPEGRSARRPCSRCNDLDGAHGRGHRCAGDGDVPPPPRSATTSTSRPGQPLESPTALPDATVVTVVADPDRRTLARRRLRERAMSRHRRSALRAAASAALALLVFAGQVAALDPSVTVQVTTWSSDTGHGYVGVQANGNWAPPASGPTQVQTEFFTRWDNQGKSWCLLQRLVGHGGARS